MMAQKEINFFNCAKTIVKMCPVSLNFIKISLINAAQHKLRTFFIWVKLSCIDNSIPFQIRASNKWKIFKIFWQFIINSKNLDTIFINVNWNRSNSFLVMNKVGYNIPNLSCKKLLCLVIVILLQLICKQENICANIGNLSLR